MKTLLTFEWDRRKKTIEKWNRGRSQTHTRSLPGILGGGSKRDLFISIWFVTWESVLYAWLKVNWLLVAFDEWFWSEHWISPSENGVESFCLSVSITHSLSLALSLRLSPFSQEITEGRAYANQCHVDMESYEKTALSAFDVILVAESQTLLN